MVSIIKKLTIYQMTCHLSQDVDNFNSSKNFAWVHIGSIGMSQDILLT